MADPTAKGSHNPTVPITSAKEHECHSSNIPISQCQPDKPQRKQLINEGDEVIKEALGN